MKTIKFLSFLMITFGIFSCETEDATTPTNATQISSEFELIDATIDENTESVSLNLNGTSGEVVVVDDIYAKINASLEAGNIGQDNASGKFAVNTGLNISEEVFFFNYNTKSQNTIPRIVLLPRRVTETTQLPEGQKRKVKEIFRYNNEGKIRRYRRTVSPPSDVDNLVSIEQIVSWNGEIIENIAQESIFTGSEENFNITPAYEDNKANAFDFYDSSNNLVQREQIVFQPNDDVNYKQRTFFTPDGFPAFIRFDQFFKDSESNIKKIERSSIDPITEEMGEITFVLNVEHENNNNVNNYAIGLLATSPDVGSFIASPEFYSGQRNRIYQTQDFSISTGDVLQNRSDADTRYNILGYPRRSDLINALSNVTVGFPISQNTSVKRYRYYIALIF